MYAYDGFQMAVANPKMLDVFGLDDSAKSTLQDQVRRRLAPKALKFRADVEVFCFGVEDASSSSAPESAQTKASTCLIAQPAANHMFWSIIYKECTRYSEHTTHSAASIV